MKRFATLLLLSLLLPLASHAQDATLFGLQPELSVGFKPWRGGRVEATQALRFTTAAEPFARSQSTIGVEQSLLRSALKPYGYRLKVGANYSFIYLADDDLHSYLPRHRFNLHASLTRRVGDFSFSLRERLKTTYQDPDRSKLSHNPKLALTTRARVAYGRGGSPWQYRADAEAYLRLNHPKGAKFNRLAFALKAERKLSSLAAVDFGLKLYQDINVKHPESLLLFTCGYRLSL